MRTKLILALALSVLAALCLALYLVPSERSEPRSVSPATDTARAVQATSSTATISAGHTPRTSKEPKQESVPQANQETAQPAPITPPEATQHVTVVVSGHSYTTPLLAPQSALAVMQQLAAATTSFSFSGKEFPSLGYFIQSINGIENAGGKYWTFYLNGVYSQVGVSSVTISPGDTLEWRFE